MACPLLPVADLLLLNRFNGRLASEELSPYDVEEYGADYASRLKNLMREGYLQFAEPEEALKYLQVPRLKDILRANNQKLSGNKSELVSRIIKNIPQGQYLGQLPTIYVVTEQGRFELEKRWYYIENQMYGHKFLNSEIEELERANPNVDILEKLSDRAIVKYRTAGDWGLLRNEYYDLYKHYNHSGRLEEALKAMLSVLYLDLSGAGNGNSVEQYKDMGWAFETSVWRCIDKLRTALNLTDGDLKERFVSATAQVAKLPFQYFDAETMSEIMIKRLHGQADLLKRYEKYSKKPRENAREYVYYKIY